MLVAFAGQRSVGLLDQFCERIPVVLAPASGEQELAGGEFGQVGGAQFPPEGAKSAPRSTSRSLRASKFRLNVSVNRLDSSTWSATYSKT